MTTLIRKAALTAAGAALAGGALAGPATAFAAPTTHTPTTSVTADRGHDRTNAKHDKGQRELRVRYEAQPNFYYCGPAAARNALTTLDRDVSQDDLAR
ncbi:C39 family peptidase, partial [Micromonospora sp. NPDC050187]|uniref:C39 family peptidase n=1 Tax=Micromonospora sp. NPDC050187 TaxID=3364277 RepID=UPI00379E1F40